jgi:hypothetical protein
MKRRLTKKLLFVLYLLLATTVLLEIAVRLSGYSEHHLCDPIYMPFAASNDIPYIHKPKLVNARARGLAIINSDSLGLRSTTGEDRFGPRTGREFRIAIVGDSVTFGEGVKDTAQTYAQLLEDELNRLQSEFRVKVFNFAASAYSVKVMEATLEQRMREVDPDLVIMAIVPTDFNLGRTPAVDKFGYLTDNKLSSFLAKDSELRLVLRKFHLIYLVRDVINPLVDQSNQAEAVLAAGQVPDAYEYLQQFAKFAEQSRLPYAIVLLPSLRSQFAAVPARLRQDGLSFIDLSAIRNEFVEDDFRTSRFDTHPSAAVHRRIAASLAPGILLKYMQGVVRED